MFFRKKASTRSGVVGPVPWDDQTCKRLADADCFNVMVTSITRTIVNGTYHGRDTLLAPRPISFEAHGIMTYPKYIVVQFGFEETRTVPVGVFFL